MRQLLVFADLGIWITFVLLSAMQLYLWQMRRNHGTTPVSQKINTFHLLFGVLLMVLGWSHYFSAYANPPILLWCTLKVSAAILAGVMTIRWAQFVPTAVTLIAIPRNDLEKVLAFARQEADKETQRLADVYALNQHALEAEQAQVQQEDDHGRGEQ